MSDTRARGAGSRFLYEPFDRASARIEAHERVTDERWRALERRLEQIETGLERMERRLWLVVLGVAAFLATDVAYQFLTLKP
ncbi:MAG: hypothetical protein AAFY59_08500 [Pseudomonadota bacterium]